LEGNNVVEEMELVLKLGLFRSHSIPTARPSKASMKQVVQFLDGDADMGELLHNIAPFRSFRSNESSDFTSFRFSQVSTPSMSTIDLIPRGGSL
jgi:hypothetical protein